ncbi:hypothetical protein N7455_001759 [Penicillium solitum]|uniref:uncharacterized protein n=1 Tax=Penicillium brevicompactum TaxID=5074 RepID=UPI0025425399|nr:uncharacterized protein N7506_003884 [Penicillium brevicompactum]KAJ5344060.1 hypothetical protein N7506_003884 [Penicillium brevicompactum]KAJ5695335.1 hypothetical protein N7536_005747 [Penicillium majusculum]KAJ5878294.1 hypothetical protein N7455_001759 [Penicillium solitum]KAJ5957290.1 hypothetical protein N7501_011569 [Penicillium viridicatum]
MKDATSRTGHCENHGSPCQRVSFRKSRTPATSLVSKIVGKLRFPTRPWYVKSQSRKAKGKRPVREARLEPSFSKILNTSAAGTWGLLK